MVKRPDANETVRPIEEQPPELAAQEPAEEPDEDGVDRAEPVRHIRIVPPGRIEAQPALGAVGEQDHLCLEVVALER